MITRVLTTKKDVEEGYMNELWEIIPTVSLVRTQINVNGELTYQGEFWVGNFDSEESALEMITSGRSIISKENI